MRKTSQITVSKMIGTWCTLLSVFLIGPLLQAEPIDQRPVVYLTFDDGPSADETTEQILEILSRHGATATFFVTGQRTRKNPEKISAILYGGHALGNHTHTHARLTISTKSEIIDEFQTTNEAVLSAGGPPLTCFRPPFGSVNMTVTGQARDMGLEMVKWSLDTRDWDPNIDSENIYTTLDRAVDGSIVLMHDGPYKRKRTVDVLEDWMAASAHLYRFDSLPVCQPYGTGIEFASADDQEPDMVFEPVTLEGLLAKLRNYRFDLQSFDSASNEQVQNESLSAKLKVASLARTAANP